MPGQLEGKAALVTGGGSGIGRATALAFGREGAKVVVSDVNADGGEETVSTIKEAGGESTFVHADVSRAADVEAMIQRVLQVYGRLDCAYNNAGIEGESTVRLHEYPEEHWDRLMSINLKGVWLCLKYEIPVMLEQGGGAIVNTASGAGLVGGRLLSAYTASKHGVVGLTKAAALEYAQDGVRVNAVCPGLIDTGMMERLTVSMDKYDTAVSPSDTPVGRLGKPQEVAEAVVWLCSDAASFVTGHAMSVDGGMVAQ
jgi:NAD(P)-dependent dehydrogenase (short-subunit alcohol dehydrogenase family)